MTLLCLVSVLVCAFPKCLAFLDKTNYNYDYNKVDNDYSDPNNGMILRRDISLYPKSDRRPLFKNSRDSYRPPEQEYFSNGYGNHRKGSSFQNQWPNPPQNHFGDHLPNLVYPDQNYNRQASIRNQALRNKISHPEKRNSPPENHTETDPALPKTEMLIKTSVPTSTSVTTEGTTNAVDNSKVYKRHRAVDEKSVDFKRTGSLGKWFDKEMSDVDPDKDTRTMKPKMVKSREAKPMGKISMNSHSKMYSRGAEKPSRNYRMKAWEKIRRNPDSKTSIHNSNSEVLSAMPSVSNSEEYFDNGGNRRDNDKNSLDGNNPLDDYPELYEQNEDRMPNLQGSVNHNDIHSSVQFGNNNKISRPAVREARANQYQAPSVLKNIVVTVTAPLQEKNQAEKSDLIDKTNEVLSKEILRSPKVEEKMHRVVENIKSKKTLINDKRLQQETSVIENEKQRVNDNVRFKSEEHVNKTETTTESTTIDDSSEQDDGNKSLLSQNPRSPNKKYLPLDQKKANKYFLSQNQDIADSNFSPQDQRLEYEDFLPPNQGIDDPNFLPQDQGKANTNFLLTDKDKENPNFLPPDQETPDFDYDLPTEDISQYKISSSKMKPLPARHNFLPVDSLERNKNAETKIDMESKFSSFKNDPNYLSPDESLGNRNFPPPDTPMGTKNFVPPDQEMPDYDYDPSNVPLNKIPNTSMRPSFKIGGSLPPDARNRITEKKNDIESKPISFRNGEMVVITTGSPDAAITGDTTRITDGSESTTDLFNVSMPDIYLKEEKVEKESKTLHRNKEAFRNKTAVVKGNRKSEIRNNKESFHEVFVQEKSEDKYPSRVEDAGKDVKSMSGFPSRNNIQDLRNPNDKPRDQNSNFLPRVISEREARNFPEEKLNKKNAANYDYNQRDQNVAPGGYEEKVPGDKDYSYNYDDNQNVNIYKDVNGDDRFIDNAAEKSDHRYLKEPIEEDDLEEKSVQRKIHTRDATDSENQQAAGNVVYFPPTTTTAQYKDFLHTREVKKRRRHLNKGRQ